MVALTFLLYSTAEFVKEGIFLTHKLSFGIFQNGPYNCEYFPKRKDYLNLLLRQLF